MDFPPRIAIVPRRAALPALGGALVLAATAGCAGPRMLVITPYVVAEAGGDSYESQVPERYREPVARVLFVSDRAPAADADDPARSFSWERSREVRFGVATVATRPSLDWPTAVRETISPGSGVEYRLEIESIEPVGHFRNLNQWIASRDGRQVLLDEALLGMAGERAAFHALMDRWLEVSSTKEAILFVHGFNNSFDDAVFRAAELWHFTGRQAVPIAYSWPAGRGGIRGYTYDRESGEYTVLHLKQTLRALAAHPDLERIHIVAHSRGTDVAATAVRELYIEARAQGEQAVRDLKIGAFVLAAPDIDVDVFGQRFVAEMLVNAPERTVVYFSPDDDAIWWARWLFDSLRRLGGLNVTQLTESERKALAQLSALECIDCQVSGFGTSHNYVFSHPAALSDLIQALRGFEPGTPERPLTRPTDGIWLLDNDYMRPHGTSELFPMPQSAPPG